MKNSETSVFTSAHEDKNIYEIVEVTTKKDLREFLDLPSKIYSEKGTRYVHPLRLHMKMMMGKLGAREKKFFLAKENGVTVARLGAKIHKHGDKTTLNFGFFEAVEGKLGAVERLFQEAQKIAPHLKMVGPFHFRMEDPYIGILVEGFELDPYFLMSYNPPYYDEYLHRVGFKKTMDLFTYQIDDPNGLSEVVFRSAAQAEASGVTIRTLNVKNLPTEARTIARIFNDALSRNWGFEEFLDDQVKEMVQMFKLFIDPRVVALAEKDQKEVGCLIMLPNYNPIIKPSKGRITPSLIWKYFRRKKIVNTVRGYALGVLRDYHGLGIGSALTKRIFEDGSKAGYVQAEVSWVLANNGPMNELSKAMGGKHNKVYRIYEKAP